MDTLGDQLGRALQDSPRFQRACERLRAEEMRPRRAGPCKRFSEYESLGAMFAAVAESRATPYVVRDYRWSDDRAARDPRLWADVPSFETPLRELYEHARRFQTQAYRWFKATAHADEFRGYVNDPARGIPIPAGLASHSALTGAGASSAYDRFTEHPTRAPRATDQAWRRVANSPIDVLEGCCYYFAPLDGSRPSDD
jgi:hypothetical protein